MVFVPRSYGIFYLSSIKHFYNKQWRKSCRTNVLILFIIWKKTAKQNKTKIKSKTKLVKENSIPPCRLAHLPVFIWKILISPRWNPGKIKWDPTKAGWPTSHMNTSYFNRSFLKKVRSHLGEPANQTGPAHLHMNSPLICYATKSFKLKVTIREIKFVTSFEFIRAYICVISGQEWKRNKIISYKLMLLFHCFNSPYYFAIQFITY